MNFKKIVFSIYFSIIAVLVSACGGGGSSSANNDGGADAEIFSGISVSVSSPLSVSVSAYSGVRFFTNITVSYLGDENLLAGKTLYALIVMPDPIFEANPAIVINIPSKSASISLTSKTDVPPGRYMGTMKLYACLDAACSVQLQNSPLSLPYDIEVMQGLALSNYSLDLTTPFGVALAPSTINVTLPEGGIDYSVLDLSGGFISKGTGTLVVSPDIVALPGTYEYTATVESSARDPLAPFPTYFRKDFRVRYTVTTSAQPFAMSATGTSNTFALNAVTQGSGNVSLVSQDSSGTFSARGIRYDSNPASAIGHARVDQWLNYQMGAFPNFLVEPCSFVPGSPDCLPAGDYTGALLVRHTSGASVTTDFELPVTMTITP